MPRGLRVVYVCKAVDERSAALATQVLWIRTLAAHPRVESVHVLTAAHAGSRLPDNVTVRTFGRPGHVRKLLAFWRDTFAAVLRKPDAFLVVQGGPWPALLLPFKLVTRRPLYQWKAHPAIPWSVRFYVRACDDLLFTATEGSFPMQSPKVHVIGHGIDTDLFRPMDAIPARDLVTVGRVHPDKRIEHMIDAVAACEREHGARYHLDVVGPCSPNQADYRDALVERAEGYGIADRIRFTGPTPHPELPKLLTGYRAALNFSSTALDKAALEAMAAALPVVATNPCVGEALPDALRDRLVVPADDTARQADAIHGVLDAPEPSRRALGLELRAVVEREHSLRRQFDRIVGDIEVHLAATRPRLARRLGT